MKSIFSKESLSIFKDRKLLIAMSAIIFVPILYAGMFLWAFWDPYDFLDDIPVAVVDEDEGYMFEGEFLTLGQELVDNLKDEDAFEFHFVDKEKGYQGLRDQEYYILIEIPEDFSKNATTVMDDTPEQLELIYVPNESYNFLASQMGETAMLQIEQALEEKITETYAETIFDKIDEVADGLVDASEATEELNDGAHELKDGSETLSEHLKTMAEKTIEFNDGVDTAFDGASELADGAGTLSVGIVELYENSIKLREASEDLQSGANQLAEGITAADRGVNDIQTNIPQLIDGTNKVQAGLNQFHNELPKEMAQKISDTVIKEKDPLRQKINGILNQKKTELSPVISERLSNEIAQGAAEGVVDAANDIIQDAPEAISSSIASEITDIIKDRTKPTIDQLKEDIISILRQSEVPDETIERVQAKLDDYSLDYNAIESRIHAKLQDSLDNALKDAHITETQQAQLEAIIKERAQNQVAAGVNEALDAATDRVDGAFDEYEEVLLDRLDDLTVGLETEVKQALNEPIGQLQDGLTAINDGQSMLLDGVNQLSEGTNQLSDGSNQLVSGQYNYVDNMYQFTSSFARANDGSNELASGAYELYKGMSALQDGAIQLSDGADELSEGSDELYDGMVTLVEGTEEFNEEMQDAADEANDVNATEKTNQMIANPVEVENEKINEVPNYGTGFAPYFLSLGLFVGALLLSIVYPLREPSSTPSSGTTWFLRKFVVLFGVGILQAFIACGILLLGLGIEVQSIPRFMLFAVITSLTFITLIQFFVTCFDDPGRFIAIIILILQLTTSAGTFPLELIPKVLQPLNAILPMTYSVAGFKAVVSSGDFGVMWQNAGILLGFSIVFIVGTWLYFIMKYKRQYAIFNETEEEAV